MRTWLCRGHEIAATDGARTGRTVARLAEGNQTMKQTQRQIRTRSVALLFGAWAVLAAVSPARLARGASCTGDCDGNGAVSINELVMMVKVALGAADMSACSVGDASGDGAISIDELVKATKAALGECEAAPDLV